MTNFSIASSALSNSADVCDFHGSTSCILSEMNCCQIPSPLRAYSKEIADELDLLVDSERLLGEVGQEAVPGSASCLPVQIWRAHLLRYLATGSAGLDRRSFRKPEKLNEGSSSRCRGVFDPEPLGVPRRAGPAPCGPPPCTPALGAAGAGCDPSAPACASGRTSGSGLLLSPLPSAPALGFCFGGGAGAGVWYGSNSARSGETRSAAGLARASGVPSDRWDVAAGVSVELLGAPGVGPGVGARTSMGAGRLAGAEGVAVCCGAGVAPTSAAAWGRGVSPVSAGDSSASRAGVSLSAASVSGCAASSTLPTPAAESVSGCAAPPASPTLAMSDTGAGASADARLVVGDRESAPPLDSSDRSALELAVSATAAPSTPDCAPSNGGDGVLSLATVSPSPPAPAPTASEAVVDNDAGGCDEGESTAAVSGVSSCFSGCVSACVSGRVSVSFSGSGSGAAVWEGSAGVVDADPGRPSSSACMLVTSHVECCVSCVLSYSSFSALCWSSLCRRVVESWKESAVFNVGGESSMPCC